MKATYSSEDFEKIAKAIGKEVEDVVKYKQLFEWAADWYGLDRGLPRERRSRLRRTPPSKKSDKLQRIAKRARRLLQALEISSYEEADDGPGNFELLESLAAVEDQSEDEVINATRRLGQFRIILDVIEAATELERRALAAAKDEIAIGNLTVPKGHQGDRAVNNWVAAMMAIYGEITGAEPATSVGGFDQPNEGIASGPLVRFLRAAGKPLHISCSEDAWRSRVRTILKSHKT